MRGLNQLQAAGVSIWLDTLSRELLDSGAFAERIADSAVTGATSNPTIFAKAITGSDRYDAQLRAAVAAGIRDPQELFFELALDDVRRAADLLRPIYDAGAGRDGFVSFECLPYFFSDQYDVGMEYSGFARTWDRVVFRGDPAGREFIAFWLAGDRVRAGMNVNVWDVVDPIQRLIRERVPVDDWRLSDPDVPLEQLTPIEGGTAA